MARTQHSLNRMKLYKIESVHAGLSARTPSSCWKSLCIGPGASIRSMTVLALCVHILLSNISLTMGQPTPEVMALPISSVNDALFWLLKDQVCAFLSYHMTAKHSKLLALSRQLTVPVCGYGYECFHFQY